MSKLFIQTIPSYEELRTGISEISPQADFDSLYTNLLLMKVANQIETRMEAVLSEYGLSGGRYTVLLILRKEGTSLTGSELAQMLGVTQATITGIVKYFESQELTQRLNHERDGRAYRIALSAKGRELVDRIFPEWYACIQDIWGPFPAEKKETVSRLMSELMGLDH